MTSVFVFRDMWCELYNQIPDPKHALLTTTVQPHSPRYRTTYTTDRNIRRNRRVRLAYCWFQSNCLRTRPPEGFVWSCHRAVSAIPYLIPWQTNMHSKSSRYILLCIGVIYTTSKNSVLKLQQTVATIGAASPACHSAEDAESVVSGWLGMHESELVLSTQVSSWLI